MRKNLLSTFLILTFGVTWSTWWLLAWFTRTGVMQRGEPLFMVLFLVGGLAPTYTPFLASRIVGGREGLRQYNRIALRWRIPVHWYFLAVALVIAARYASAGICHLAGIEFTADFHFWAQLFPTFLVMIIGGGAEEFGWRGMALPELLKKFDPVTSTIILGLIWSLWHLPLFHVVGTSQYQSSLLMFTGQTVAISFVLTWLYLKTKSVVIPLLAHAASNAVSEVFYLSGGEEVQVIDLLVKLSVGLVLVLAWQFGNRKKAA